MSVTRYILGLFFGAALAVPALSADVSTVREAMQKGDYRVAYVEAGGLQTADGLALAAESLLSEIMLGQAKKNKKQAKQARKLAEAALEIDSAHQNARLQHAIADGFVTRETGDVSAWMKKLPQKTEAIVQAYRTDFPNDRRGDALLGAWHLAIARKAGNKNAEKWFGASIAQGQALFTTARTTKPDDIIIGINYAFSLLALSDEDFPEIAEPHQILSQMVTLTPQDHLGEALQAYAKEALVRIDDREAVRTYADMFLEGETPRFD
jgi:hypothetical protein